MIIARDIDGKFYLPGEEIRPAIFTGSPDAAGAGKETALRRGVMIHSRFGKIDFRRDDLVGRMLRQIMEDHQLSPGCCRTMAFELTISRMEKGTSTVQPVSISLIVRIPQKRAENMGKIRLFFLTCSDISV